MLTRLKPKSEFSRNVLTLMTGTTIAQAIPIAVSPILTRIYTPEDFGVFSIFISLVTILSVVVTGRYEVSIIIPKKENDALNLLVLSIFITLISSLLIFTLIVIYSEYIVEIEYFNKIKDYIILIPAITIIMGIYQSLNYYLNRKRFYKKIVNAKLLQAGSTAFFNLSFGFLGSGSYGMILASILGYSLSTLFHINSVYCNIKQKIKCININRIKILALKFKNFPKINLWHALIGISEVPVLIFLIGKFYSLEVLGMYTLVNRINFIPGTILASSISQVFYQDVSNKINDNKNIHKLMVKILFFLVLVMFIPMIVLYFYSEQLFTIIFGEKWTEAGLLLKCMLPFLFFKILVSSFSQLPNVLNKQKDFFILSIIGLSVLFITVFIFSGLGMDINSVFIAVSISMTIYFIFLLKWIFDLGKVYDEDINNR